MPYKIQNNKCNTELEHEDQGTLTLTTNYMLTGVICYGKKLDLLLSFLDINFFNN